MCQKFAVEIKEVTSRVRFCLSSEYQDFFWPWPHRIPEQGNKKICTESLVGIWRRQHKKDRGLDRKSTR